ncbi:MAG: hypothetical protein CVV27_14570 [Candidatus Melainabacteria bacterium HGW-Melainabacteria-1]|nr:MAG: hypothetical protein CVV27_14570 [Candidatus Melainabacteria bacterium HGW-Melainabacteria-1]
MECVRIFPLKGLTSFQHRQLWQAQQEAARVWNQCKDAHLQARIEHLKWPQRTELQQVTKGLYALHSQSVQMICHAFLSNVEATRELRKSGFKIRYPYKTKLFYPLLWPAQAVKLTANRVILPMGRGREKLVLKLKLPAGAGACKLVYAEGYELHVTYYVEEAQPPEPGYKAAVDLGEIHQAAVSTDTGKALVVSGRGIRTLKRDRAKALGEIAKKRSRCKPGSRRRKKLNRAARKVSQRAKRRIRDLRHKGTRKVIDFCLAEGVDQLYVGNPHGVRQKRAGRKHNQRMSNWEYGKDIQYLKDKSKQAGIHCFTGTERGTSSQCPECQHRQKPKGRQWVCRACGFCGHRDVVGSVNMHPIAFDAKIGFPTNITYLRPGPISRRRSSSLDTGQSCLVRLRQQPQNEPGQQSCLSKAKTSTTSQESFVRSGPTSCIC